MYRTFIALALAGVVAGCTFTGGNPNDAGNDEGVGTGAQPLIKEPTVEDAGTGDQVDTSDVNVYGADLNADLTMNDMTFDPATGELVLNNMPFDGGQNTYARDAAGTAALAGTGSGFEAYRNTAGSNRYYAVFRRSDSGFSQVGAVGTDSYISFGFGGVSAQRLEGSGAIPTPDNYVFNGEYAAVRTFIDPATGSQVQYVSGTIQLRVDIEDFDTTGAVEGIITNRQFFDANGIEINDIAGADFISLATATINFDNWTINSSTATSQLDGMTAASGNWQGLFAGPNGEEIAGVVFVEGQGAIGVDPATGDYIQVQVRESGAFVAER